MWLNVLSLFSLLWTSYSLVFCEFIHCCCCCSLCVVIVASSLCSLSLSLSLSLPLPPTFTAFVSIKFFLLVFSLSFIALLCAYLLLHCTLFYFFLRFISIWEFLRLYISFGKHWNERKEMKKYSNNFICFFFLFLLSRICRRLPPYSPIFLFPLEILFLAAHLSFWVSLWKLLLRLHNAENKEEE